MAWWSTTIDEIARQHIVKGCSLFSHRSGQTCKITAQSRKAEPRCPKLK